MRVFSRKKQMSCSPNRKLLCGQRTCSVCYARSFANHPRASNWSSKNKKEPYEVLRCSNKTYIFDCTDCYHEIAITPNRIVCGGWCKYCNHGGLCEDSNCLFCFQQSFASHPMASSWSSKNVKTARQVTRGNDTKFWFDCVDCKHTFETVPYSIVKDKHCPYCTNQKLCENDDCTICFEKSCASHSIHKAWSSENELIPRQVFLQSNKKMKFNCLVCEHSYQTSVTHYYNREGSCPYCSNKYLCDKDCSYCFQKSFASHPLIHRWSTKNTITPRELLKGSERKCIFECTMCNSEFTSFPYNIVIGYGCPYCKKKTEAKVLAFLKAQGGWSTQLRFNWCRFSNTGNMMPFDFGCNKILIEVDGAQHFTQVSNWNSPESVQAKDIEKITKSIQEGYSIIHIYQVDIWSDKYDWKDVLEREIKRLSNAEPQCSFISQGPIYETHILKLDSSIKYTILHPISS